MGKKKTTTKTTPWAPAEGSIKGALSGLDAANQSSTAAIQQFTPSLDAAIGKATNLMSNPPQYLTDARTQLDKTINGDYVNSNPYSGGLADLIAQKTGAQYNSTFGGAGRASGGLAALLSGQGVGDALQQFYSNQYNTERGFQQQAIGAAPTFHQDEYTDPNAAVNLITSRAMLPLQAANAYGSGVTAVSSPYNTTTQKQSGGLGGLLAGLALQAGGSLIPGMSGLLGGGNPMSPGINLGGGTSNYFASHPMSFLG